LNDSAGGSRSVPSSALGGRFGKTSVLSSTAAAQKELVAVEAPEESVSGSSVASSSFETNRAV